MALSESTPKTVPLKYTKYTLHTVHIQRQIQMQRDMCVSTHTHGDTKINALRDIDANTQTQRDIYRGTHRYMDTDTPTSIHNTCTQRHVYIMNNCVTSVTMPFPS